MALPFSGYDGGDCCGCTCVSTPDATCGENGGFDCVDPDSSCGTELVEAVTKTAVSVSTNMFDTRAGEAFGDVGCGETGCRPELTMDGSVDLESRWACAQKLNPGGGVCQIVFVFEDPQDIVEVQVAFYKGSERSRTLQVKKLLHDKQRKLAYSSAKTALRSHRSRACIGGTPVYSLAVYPTRNAMYVYI